MRLVSLVLVTVVFMLGMTEHLRGDKKEGNGTTISGFVTDNSNGEALLGANVYLKELNHGSTTNIGGYYVIPDIPKGVYTLIVSYIGYRTEAIKINLEKHNRQIDFKLKSSSVETEEVIVSADSVRVSEKLFAKPVSKIAMTSTQIKQVPQVIEADLLRSLQTLPGVTSLSDFSSALYIRGGTPDQNLYLVDGTDVYNPEHAFGIFSTFNTDAIKKVDLYKGGFSADYGGRLSSVLDVTNVDGNRKEFEGTFNLSLLSASTTLQMPIGDIGSVSGSFRRTYIDQTYAKWIDEVPAYYFYDGNIKAYFDFDRKNKLSISFFNGKDNLDFKLDKDAPESIGFGYYWGNTTGSVNWKHIFSPKVYANFWVTGSRFKSNFDFDAVRLTEENTISDYTAKASIEYFATKNLALKFGMGHKIYHEYYNQDMPEQQILFDNHRQISNAYLSAEWRPTSDWVIQGGVRANLYNADTSFFNLAPRFSVKYKLDEFSSMKFAAGRYYQYLNRLPRLFFTSIWSSANKYNKESASNHYIFGYQRELFDIWQFEIEGYYKTYENLYKFNDHIATDIRPSSYDKYGRPVYSSSENAFNRGDGESFGVEVMLRKEVGMLNGWVSYAYSKTNYKFDDINQDNYFKPRHDRSSIVNAVVNADLTNWFFGDEYTKPTSKLKIGVNFIYATGQPITVPASAYYTNTVPDQGDLLNPYGNGNNYNLYPGKMNSYNLPDYIRMDFSITYEKQYDGWSIAPYLQVFNIGNRQNTWFIQYEDEKENGRIVQKIDKVNMLPLLPSLGVNIKF